MSALTDHPRQPRTRAWTRGISGTLIAALATGMLACGLLIFAHEVKPRYVIVLFAAVAIVALLPLVSNVRLLCLYCIILLAPLSLRASFAVHPHMGGAAGVYVETVDPWLLLLLYFQLRDRVRGYRSTYRFPPEFVPWLALMVLGLVVSIFAGLRTLATLEVLRMVKLLVLALVVVNEVVRRRQFEHAVVALMIGVIIEAGIALTQTFRGAQLGLGLLGEASDADIELLGSTSLESGEFVYRAGALLGHANLFAAFLALFMPVAIALILSQSPRLLRALSVIALLMGLPALVLTLSRGGWLAFVVAFVIVIALGVSHPTSRRLFVFSRTAVVCVVLAVAIALSPLIVKRLSGADPSSVKWRIEWVKTARGMIMDNPAFGVGLNAYVFRQLPYGEFKTPVEMAEFYGDFWPVVHNSWLIVWAEQGTVGLLIWIAFHIGVIAVAIRNLRIRDPMLHALNVGLLAGFVAIMVDGVASFYVRQEPTARTFWIVVALILAAGYWRRLNEEEVPALAAAPGSPDAFPPGANAPAQERWLPARTSPLR